MQAATQVDTVDRVIRSLKASRMNAASESQLHESIKAALTRAGHDWKHEVPIGNKRRDRIDFVVCDSIGIEVKVSGSYTDVVSQLLRYAEAPELEAVVLVTSHAALKKLASRKTLGDKPFHVVFIAFSCF